MTAHAQRYRRARLRTPTDASSPRSAFLSTWRDYAAGDGSRSRRAYAATAMVLGLVTYTTSALADAADTAPDLVPEGTALNQVLHLFRFSGVMTSLVVAVVAWIGLRFARNLIETLSQRFTTQRLVMQQLGTVIQFVVYLGTAVVVTLLSVRLDDKVLTLIGGTAAVAIGFATKDLVASFIAGVTVMIDRPFQVGDRVSFGGEYGDIVAIGLRSVRMQTLDDNTVTIPNNKFLSDMTSCANYGALDMQVKIDFYIGVADDVMRAKEIVTEAALTSRYVHLPKPVVVLVGQVVEHTFMATRLRLRAYVLDTRYESAFISDVTLRVLDAFRQVQIQPPAQHVLAGQGAGPLPPPAPASNGRSPSSA